ncbi:hypothetical protein C8R45DRAFT_935724 [Mycena sanguinolenta]|nr:hypothetical protein C8R45DRAFT_935724 [Mycena sanguinolenta]
MQANWAVQAETSQWRLTFPSSPQRLFIKPLKSLRFKPSIFEASNVNPLKSQVYMQFSLKYSSTLVGGGGIFGSKIFLQVDVHSLQGFIGSTLDTDHEDEQEEPDVDGNNEEGGPNDEGDARQIRSNRIA